MSLLMHLKLGREVIFIRVHYCCPYIQLSSHYPVYACEPLILVWAACLINFMLNISEVIWFS